MSTISSPASARLTNSQSFALAVLRETSTDDPFRLRTASATAVCVACQVTLDISALREQDALVQIESIRHKPLRRFAETGVTRGLPSGSAERLRNMLAYLSAMDGEEELLVPPNYGAHRLTGDRKGSWALTVTRNWRMTFRINDAGGIEDMDLEDYH